MYLEKSTFGSSTQKVNAALSEETVFLHFCAAKRAGKR